MPPVKWDNLHTARSRNRKEHRRQKSLCKTASFRRKLTAAARKVLLQNYKFSR